MTVRVPADKRFRRVQVKPVAKRRARGARLWRLARKLAVVIAAGYGAYRGGQSLVHAPAFQVDRIVVRGNDRLSTGEVLALLKGLSGESILLVDLELWRRRLLECPWVDGAVLRKMLPSTVEVGLSERAPMGLGRLSGQLYLVDVRGVIIDAYGPRYADVDLPIIDGLAAAQGDRGASVDRARARLAALLMEAIHNRRDLVRRISQIDVRNAQDAVVILEGDPALIHLGDQQFAERLQSYLDLAPALRARVPAIDYVDLRFDERVYVRPATSGKRPERALTLLDAPQGTARVMVR